MLVLEESCSSQRRAYRALEAPSALTNSSVMTIGSLSRSSVARFAAGQRTYPSSSLAATDWPGPKFGQGRHPVVRSVVLTTIGRLVSSAARIRDCAPSYCDVGTLRGRLR